MADIFTMSFAERDALEARMQRDRRERIEKLAEFLVGFGRNGCIELKQDAGALAEAFTIAITECERGR